MHEVHEALYDAMSMIVTQKGKTTKVNISISDYLTIEGYIEVDDIENARITKKGLELLGKLEEFKHNDLSRVATWVGIIGSIILSIMATIVSFIALYKGGGN